MNQMRPVAKRDNLYTLSLFALKLWLFRLKYILKLRKHTFKNVDKFFGLSPGLTNARPPGRAKLANAPPPGLTRRANPPQLPGGGGRAQLELTDALYVSMHHPHTGRSSLTSNLDYEPSRFHFVTFNCLC